MYAQDLIGELGRQSNMPDLRLDHNGLARLVFDGKVTVDIEFVEAKDCLWLYTIVGHVPLVGREQFCLRLLHANLFGQHAGDGAFSVDPLNNEILLIRRFDLEGASVASLQAALASVVDAAEQHEQSLLQQNTAANAQAEPAAANWGMMMRG